MAADEWKDKKALADAAEKIDTVIKSVEQLTGAKVAFNDVSGLLYYTELKSYIPNIHKLSHHDSEYCYYVRALPSGRIKCINCDKRDVMDSLQRSTQPFPHRCHAGVSEIIIPIIVKGQLFLSAYLGQVRDYDESDVPEELNELTSNAREAYEMFNKLPKVKLNVLSNGAYLLKYALEGCLNALPDEILRNAFTQSNFSTASRVHSLLSAMPERSYKVSDLADAMYMSPESLSRLYRKETGTSLKKLLDEKSFGLAKSLLKDYDDESVSANLGFASKNDFWRWYKKRERASVSQNSSSEQAVKQYTRRAQDYLHAHFRERFRVEALASSLGITPDHLNRVFKKNTGQTVTEALWEMRVSSARQELEETAFSAKVIAGHNGFISAPDFIKRFKQITGLSPEEYREVHGISDIH